jgi:acetyl esterase/lipase
MPLTTDTAEAKAVIRKESGVPYEVMTRIMRAGQKDGSIKRHSARELALVFWTSITGLALHRVTHGVTFKAPDVRIPDRSIFHRGVTCPVFAVRFFCSCSKTGISSGFNGNGDPTNSLASPLYGDLSRLPPLLIIAGGDDLLRDDSTRFAEKARLAGVDVTLRVGAGMFHCYPVCAPLFPEAREAMDEICAFIRRQLS